MRRRVSGNRADPVGGFILVNLILLRPALWPERPARNPLRRPIALDAR
jgi:hypothetical protein